MANSQGTIDAYNAWTGSYIMFQDKEKRDNYYIHLKQENIGKANNGSSTSYLNVIKNYTLYRNTAFAGDVNQFQRLFDATIRTTTDQKTLNILDQAFKTNLIDNMSSIQSQMAKKLQKALPVEKMSVLMQRQKAINVEKLAAQILHGKSVTQSCRAFDSLLNGFVKSIKLLTGKQGQGLQKILLSARSSKTQNFQISGKKGLGANLFQALTNFEKDNKNKKRIYSASQALLVAQQIKILANSLQTKTAINEQTNKQQSLTEEALIKIINNVFSSGLAQAVSGQIRQVAEEGVVKAVKDGIKSELTGGKTTKIQFTDALGTPRDGYSQKKQGKADVVFKNIKISMQMSDKQIELSFNALGISDKFYKSNNFITGTDENGLYQDIGSIHGGGVGSLKEAIETLFNDTYNRYIAFNIIGHSNKAGWIEAYDELKRLIIIRQITRGFAARGGNNDFAQFIFANGQVIPIWDIITATYENIRNSPVSMTVDTKTSPAAENKQEKFLNQRVKNVNNAINKAYISFNLNTKKLINYKSRLR